MNLDDQILDLDDKPVENGATYKTAILLALLNPLRGDESMEGKEKVALFSLSQRINAGGEIQLGTEDAETIKKRVAKCYPPLMVGRIWQAIDPAGTKTDGQQASR